MVIVLFADCLHIQIKGILAKDISGVVTILGTVSRWISAEEHNLSVHQLELICIAWVYQEFEDVIGQQSVILYSDYKGTDSSYAL